MKTEKENVNDNDDHDSQELFKQLHTKNFGLLLLILTYHVFCTAIKTVDQKWTVHL